MARPHTLIVAALTLHLGGLVAACGTSCPAITRDLESFDRALGTRAAPAPDEPPRPPDARVDLAVDTLNAAIADVLQDEGAPGAAIPTLSLSAGLDLPPLWLTVMDVRVEGVRGGPPQAIARLGLKDDEGPLMTLIARADLRFELGVDDAGAKTLRWRLDPADVHTITPQPDPGRLSAWLQSLLPPVWRGAAADRLLRLLIPELSGLVSELAWPAVRDELLVPAGLPLVALEIPLPPWPVGEVALATDAGPTHVGVLLFTDLDTPAAPSPLPAPDHAHAVEVAISGPLAMHLVALAMRDDLLPARLDDDGNLDPEAPWHARATWLGDRRPFGLNLWRFDGTCQKVTLDAELRLEASADGLAVTVVDGQVASAAGPGLMESFAWLARIFRPALNMTLVQPVDSDLTFGGRSYRLTLRAARRVGAALSAAFSVEGD